MNSFEIILYEFKQNQTNSFISFQWGVGNPTKSVKELKIMKKKFGMKFDMKKYEIFYGTP